MREINSISEVQSIAYGILEFIKKVCDEHNIRYYLAYGTLLGAVRHKGFIPWDDDIDIFMPEEDYRKFLSVLNDVNHPFYKMVSKETDENCLSPLPKLIDDRTLLVQKYGFNESTKLGIYVDIFILYGCGNDKIEAANYHEKAYRSFKGWVYSNLKMFPADKNKFIGLICWIKNFPFRFKGTKKYLKELNEYQKKYSFYDSRYVAAIQEEKDVMWLQHWFSEGTQIRFQDSDFCVPSDYETFLTDYFGDYLKLPPEEERVSRHVYDAYWK